MTPTETAAIEDLCAAAAIERFDRVLAKAEAELAHPRAHRAPKRSGRPHSPRTKRKLSAATFERRRAQKLLNEPTAVARVRLAAGLTQLAASEKALIDSRTWCRAESDFASVSKLTRKRVARALAVRPSDLL